MAKPRAPRFYERIVDAIMTALDEQTVVVPGTCAAEVVIPKLATQLAELLEQRATVAAQVEEILDAHPLSTVRGHLPRAQRVGGTLMRGIGVSPARGRYPQTAARILVEVGEGTTYQDQTPAAA